MASFICTITQDESIKRHSAPVKKFEMAKKEEVAVEAKAEEKKPAKKAASKKA
jgi:hypothetical protein